MACHGVLCRLGIHRHGRLPSNVRRARITQLPYEDDPIARGSARAMAGQQGGSLMGTTGRTAVMPGSSYFGRHNGYLDGNTIPLTLVQTRGTAPSPSLLEQRALPAQEGPIVSQNMAVRALRRNGGGGS
jgi:hypothetical protein